MGCFWFRGGVKSTRYGGLVAGHVVSCRRVVAELGMIIRDWGSRYWTKGGYLIKSGEIGSSKGIGIQDNDGRGNQPKRYL